MPPLRAPRLRLVLLAVTLLLGCGLGAYPAATAGELLPVATTLAIAGVVFTALALVRWTHVIGAALACLAGEYLLTEAAGSVATISIVAYAAGLVVLCELVFWAERLRGIARVDGSVVLAEVRRLALIAAASAVLAIVVLAATGLRLGGSLVLTLAGVVAAVAFLALPLLLARGRPRR
jgi:hypothetical protein